MELNYLRVFFEVAKDGRFTETAKRLHISQSALSRSVALLEESAGVKLLDRSKQGVKLTSKGAEVFRLCEEIFQTVHRINEVCRGSQEVCEGPLRLAATDHIVNYLLLQPLQNFRKDFPLVVPVVSIGAPDEIIESVLNDDCEFGLSFAKVVTPQIAYEALHAEPMSLVVHPEVWQECKGPNQAATLKKVLNKVGYISSIGALGQKRGSRVLFEIFGEMPRIGFEVSGQEEQKRICLAGGGVAYLSRFMVEREIKNGHLHEVTIEEPHVFKLWLVTRKGKVMSLPGRRFLDRLRAQWM
ncbi:LysR family transcriptional regulator [Bdellovibrio svalbardensis]|uniref:LysR family transcriptional regulator n=1 Tax=Bdellovibrio svalbardensis TaxID=2972972 RepID=A0ABT6DLD4_9BACT|nr:LysR family transcriptional regulator [Bdellovibrio svalbardensis]MDG0817687.1 LysR family transcriptional regulator [Bdellovibrio svalbardensis]